MTSQASAVAARPRKGRRAQPPLGAFTAPAEAARAASLQYVSDERPGISRRRAGSGFAYTTTDGTRVRDAETIGRIRSLAIPPAWRDVWICPLENGHLQASGRDVKGRKQYRYHPRWRAVRDETKYERMILFGHALPRVRRRVQKDLALPELPREKVLATIVRLLETTFIRVGNEEYARTNGSFGLTTMQDRHVRIAGRTLEFRFRGKSGRVHTIELSDARLSQLVKRFRDIPGQDLFQYVDDAGERRSVSSTDVNEYLRSISDEDFTAKDFRTWAGTLLAASAIAGSTVPETKKAIKSSVLAAVAGVADKLGNTVSVCRKCYIHPAVLEAFEKQDILELWGASTSATAPTRGLSREETALLHFLESCAGRERTGPSGKRATNKRTASKRAGGTRRAKATGRSSRP